MYSFYLDGELLPVTPDKLTVKIKGANKTLTLVNDSDVNILRLPGLTEISFDLLLPMLGKYSFAESYKRPDYYLSLLENLMNGQKPFWFIVSRLSPSGQLLYDTNMKVSLENYTITEDASKGADVYVSVELKQFKPFSTKIVRVDGSERTALTNTVSIRESDSAPKVNTYTVKYGDCLWNIAKRFYGSGSQYQKIYDANRDKLKNPNIIYAGQVLTIP